MSDDLEKRVEAGWREWAKAIGLCDLNSGMARRHMVPVIANTLEAERNAAFLRGLELGLAHYDALDRFVARASRAYHDSTEWESDDDLGPQWQEIVDDVHDTRDQAAAFLRTEKKR